MMSVNHPRSYVLGDILRHVCRTKGLGQPVDVDFGSLFPDDLTDAPIFPLYPEIGRGVGVTGGHYYFKAAARGAVGEIMDLGTFIDQSFETLADVDHDELRQPLRVQQVLTYLQTLPPA
jgi:hypothetical protein